MTNIAGISAERSPIRGPSVALLVSILLTVGILVYIFQTISVTDVLRLIAEAEIRGVAAFLLCSLGMSFFRWWRYRLLLRTVGYDPPKFPLLLIVFVRNLFADLLPARVGTLMYVFLVTTRLAIPVEAALASFALAFLFDLLAVVPLILFATFFAGASGMLSPYALFAGTVFLGLVFGGLIVWLPQIVRLGARWMDRVPLLSTRMRNVLREKLELVEGELVTVKNAGIYGRVLSLSVAVRVAKYAGLYAILYALLSPRGYTLQDLDPAKVFLGICAAELSSSLPISGIAGFGLYQGTWLVVFQLLGFPERIATLTSVSHHLFTQAYGYSLGFAAFALLLLPVFRVRSLQERQTFAPGSGGRFFTRFTAASAFLGICLVLILSASSASAERKPNESIRPSAEEEQLLREFRRDAVGEVVFDSDRSGTFGIYALDIQSGGVRRIADTPNLHEVYPDPSPDGARIVYAGQRSPKKDSVSDIWMVNTDGSGARRIAENGTFPTFDVSGRRVFFERDRSSVIALDLESDEERVLFSTDTAPGWKRKTLSKPRVSPDGKFVAFTADRPKRWSAWIVNLETGAETRLGHGCEPTWAVDGRSLLWVWTERARERTGFFRFDREGGQTTEFHDRDAPFGHEYFPTLAADDRYLVYSACPAGEHDHESANYQVFVNDRKTQRTIRVTFDHFTNRWPKLIVKQ